MLFLCLFRPLLTTSVCVGAHTHSPSCACVLILVARPGVGVWHTHSIHTRTHTGAHRQTETQAERREARGERRESTQKEADTGERERQTCMHATGDKAWRGALVLAMHECLSLSLACLSLSPQATQTDACLCLACLQCIHACLPTVSETETGGQGEAEVVKARC